MNTTLLHSLIVPFSLLMLGIAPVVTADNESSAANPHLNLHTEKKSSEEFWSDFQQDSKQTWKDSKAAFKDGWIESKLVTAINLNKYLSPYDIDIRVDNNIATLNGQVYSNIHKELAGNIALGVEGIDTVSNNLVVVEKSTEAANTLTSQGRSFAQYVSDVTITAAIKTELLASKNIKGLEINVDTLNDQVTLSGKVDTPEQKALAQAIAAKRNDVKDVVNNLQVK